MPYQQPDYDNEPGLQWCQLLADLKTYIQNANNLPSETKSQLVNAIMRAQQDWKCF